MTHLIRAITPVFTALVMCLGASCSSTKPQGRSLAGTPVTVREALEYKTYSANAAGMKGLGSTGDYRRVTTTAYCHRESDHIRYGAKTAIGCQLRYDQVRSAATDWSVFPVGTIFRIVGQPYLYRVDDYGSALVGTGKIDLFTPSMAHVRAWGKRPVTIEVLRWGSLRKSYEILADRSRYRHVAQMLASIRRQVK